MVKNFHHLKKDRGGNRPVYSLIEAVSFLLGFILLFVVKTVLFFIPRINTRWLLANLAASSIFLRFFRALFAFRFTSPETIIVFFGPSPDEPSLLSLVRKKESPI